MQGCHKITEWSSHRISANGSSYTSQGRTQKAINHPNGPMVAPQGGFVPGVPVAGGGEVVLTEIPPMTISTTSVRPSTNPTALF